MGDMVSVYNAHGKAFVDRGFIVLALEVEFALVHKEGTNDLRKYPWNLAVEDSCLSLDEGL